VWKGRQFVVIAAGGHGEAGAKTGDAIVAFALPAPGEAGRTWWDENFEQPGRRAGIQIAALALLIAVISLALVSWQRRRQR